MEPAARRIQRRDRVRPKLSTWLSGARTPGRLEGLRAELSLLLEDEAARLLGGNGTHLYGGGKRLRTALVLLVLVLSLEVTATIIRSYFRQKRQW